MNKTTGLVLSVSCIFFSALGLSACSDDKEKAQQTVGNIASGVEELKDKVEEAVPVTPETATAIEESTATVTETKNEMEQFVSEPDVQEESLPDETAMKEVAEEGMSPGNEGTSQASPQTHNVRAVVTKFQPMVLFVNPGDTVTWTNMAGHDTAAIEGMVPEGVELWHSKMGDQFSYTFSETGAYVYKCTPHVSLGMLGAIIVGEGQPGNLQQIVEHPGNKGMIGRVVRKMKKAIDGR